SVAGTGVVTLAASAGGIALSGVVDATLAGTLDLAAASGVNQSGGSITAGLLRSTSGVTGNVTLTQVTNMIGTIGGFRVNVGDFTLADSVALNVIGALSAVNVTLADSAAGTALTVSGSVVGTGTIALDTSAGGILLPGAVDATATGTLDVVAATGVNQTGGSITAGLLRSTSGVTGDVLLTSLTNAIGTVGSLVVSGGDLTFVDAQAVTFTGTVSGAGVHLTDTANGTAITLNGVLNASTFLTLDTPSGGIAQAASAVIATSLLTSGGAGGTVDLAGTANAVDTVGAFAVSSGDFRLVDSAAVTLAGPLLASAGNVAVTDSAGGTAITVTGSVSAGGTLTLSAGSGSGAATVLPAIALTGASNLAAARVALFSTDTGHTVAIDQTDGAVIGGVPPGGSAVILTGRTASGDVRLTSSANTIGTLDAFDVSGGDLLLTDSVPLTIASGGASTGTPLVRADNATVLTLGTAVGQDVVITGDIAIPGTLTITANGTIQRTNDAAAFVVGTLTGSAIRLADFGTGLNIATLGRFTVTGSELVLSNAQPLTIAGPISAGFLRITATGSMILAGDIQTLGLTRVEQGLGNLRTITEEALRTPLPDPGSYLAVMADASGAPASFTQVVPVNITSTTNDVATLRIQLLSNGGSIALGDINAPRVDLILFPGGTGTVSGTGFVDLYGLLVAGKGGKATLSGQIATLGGQAAANKANITPIPDNNYRFNTCPIGSVNCVLSSINILPPVNPLQNFSIGEARNDDEDLDLILPNVSDEDY
ncbi:MAG: hypothetical protein J0H91_17890, partial [Rhodospirillales bacterium]|nr:hypothetical protein [Rhodospirillales bacterium]